MLSLGILGAGVANRSPAGFESSSVMLDPPRTPDAMLAARKDRETVETLAQTIQDIKADTAEAVHATEVSIAQTWTRFKPEDGLLHALRVPYLACNARRLRLGPRLSLGSSRKRASMSCCG